MSEGQAVASGSIQSQIYGHFATLIRSAELAAGDRVPTEAEIARDYGVSRATVQAVMTRLSHEGLIERFPGRGSFVRDRSDGADLKVDLDIHNIQSFESEAALVEKEIRYRLVAFSQVPVPERAARKLGIAPGTSVFSLHRVRLIEDKPIGDELRYFAPGFEIQFDTVALATAAAHSLIEDGMGLRIGRIEADLCAVTASAETARHLQVTPGAPLLMRVHTLFSTEDQVIMHGESCYVQPFSFHYVARFRK
ncbi:GntR family transcriptional regulator [Frigidibacter sp. MR17.14]|uniref:GntR family transcriptional regulator n=1 Tax=Frigidibacter sp. MR17.14 TaxID=3126509 RepID=UPI003012F782